MNLEDRIWDLIDQYIAQDEILAGADLHQGAAARLTVSVWEILYVLGERKESNVEFLTKAAQKVGSLLAHRGENTEEEQQALDTLQHTLGNILGFKRDDCSDIMLSVDPSIKNKFEMICLMKDKSPSEVFKELVLKEPTSLRSFVGEEVLDGGDC